MAKHDYFPSQDAALHDWTTNFETKILSYADPLALTPDERNALIAAPQAIRTALATNVEAQATAHKATADKNAAVSAQEVTLRAIIKRAKTAPGYTEAIGKDLQIIGSDDVSNFAGYKPALTAQVYPGHVTLSFQKLGAEGVNIYSRLKGTAAWTKLAFDSHSPYVDNRATATAGVAENREYMAMGVVNDEEVGQQSDIVSATFGG